jgi:hypothetical protein
MRRIWTALVLGGVLVLLRPQGAGAWLTAAHQAISRGAVAALPTTMPAFFTEGAGVIADASADPDYFRGRAAPQLTSAEGPEHFFDAELLQGSALPPTRYEYIALCQRLGVGPEHAGLLPYAVVEWTQRLMMAFAEHRRWPQDKAIAGRCLVYAGLLSHYAADLCQPLHCTVDFDGRVDKNGQALGPRGIHLKVDALLTRPEIDPAWARQDLKVQAFPEVFPAVVAEIGRSRALVDAVYALEPKLPAFSDRRVELNVAPELRAFERERFGASAAFVASLYLTAWEKSVHVVIPDWVEPTGAPVGK